MPFKICSLERNSENNMWHERLRLDDPDGAPRIKNPPRFDEPGYSFRVYQI